ncbi:cell filamentation protein Fic [Candidatus Kaiserbacteria bacterium CG10_big_fil_rev_8_21_14_0_10_59_10]|uniref:Cell filamentation protein Fic n=1 Tax=Candidatus Kaiserbacteria bacterium CG10_big_fil_rev_8_21_14_0_10_59_10 TaxID=1974612 RepID=A0A2H0U858_9BACT|nr:MAG: cell filamentation protein Fic [Candidatus Kaiserbacteria bacterium CG10_big_fil_rev_8_21_14_0_10_59_10]
MNVEIGKNIKQKEGFSAFVLHPFPPKGLFDIPQELLLKVDEAGRLVGKLDGATTENALPDVDFFLRMFVAKDATSSAQIEGTRATIIDALEMESGVAAKETDADDILYYIKALNYGLKRLDSLPLSLRLIREIHSELMTGARSSHFSDPGEFRKSQNWIGGTRPDNAHFVPPSVLDMKRSLDDFEKFLHSEQVVLPLVHIGIMHAHFETIHPFLDGNGRTGRLLITLLLCHRKLLERPVLFLSSYFKKHQKVYYQKLDDYHNGDVESWMRFFLDGVIETAQESIEISRKIRSLRDTDMMKIQALAKRESKSGVLVLSHLFGMPIVNTARVMEWTGFTRAGAQKVIDRFIKLGILESQEEKGTYDRSYIYRNYVNIFLT